MKKAMFLLLIIAGLFTMSFIPEKEPVTMEDVIQPKAHSLPSITIAIPGYATEVCLSSTMMTYQVYEECFLTPQGAEGYRMGTICANYQRPMIGDEQWTHQACAECPTEWCVQLVYL